MNDNILSNESFQQLLDNISSHAIDLNKTLNLAIHASMRDLLHSKSVDRLNQLWAVASTLPDNQAVKKAALVFSGGIEINLSQMKRFFVPENSIINFSQKTQTWGLNENLNAEIWEQAKATYKPLQVLHFKGLQCEVKPKPFDFSGLQNQVKRLQKVMPDLRGNDKEKAKQILNLLNGVL